MFRYRLRPRLQMDRRCRRLPVQLGAIMRSMLLLLIFSLSSFGVDFHLDPNGGVVSFSISREADVNSRDSYELNLNHEFDKFTVSRLNLKESRVDVVMVDKATAMKVCQQAVDLINSLELKGVFAKAPGDRSYYSMSLSQRFSGIDLSLTLPANLAGFDVSGVQSLFEKVVALHHAEP